jgi:paraquat-inducible protein A
VTAEAVIEPREIWEQYGAQARSPRLLGRQSRSRLDRSQSRSRLDRSEGRSRLDGSESRSRLDGSESSPPLACHACDQLVPARQGRAGEHRTCPRCGAPLHRRKPDALARTWALVIAAAILYIPANVLPVMRVTYFGSGEPDTIMSGIRELVEAEMYPVALLVFFASILVPMFKLTGLVWLLLSVQSGAMGGARVRTQAYRIIEGIGRWSMVDIFMIGILISLVNLGAIATIQPGLGALCFASVVILTMLASASFDPRLIWDVRAAQGASDAFARV